MTLFKCAVLGNQAVPTQMAVQLCKRVALEGRELREHEEAVREKEREAKRKREGGGEGEGEGEGGQGEAVEEVEAVEIAMQTVGMRDTPVTSKVDCICMCAYRLVKERKLSSKTMIQVCAICMLHCRLKPFWCA